MKTVVTGASGGFAREAVRLLLQNTRPEDLILVSRDPAKVADLAALGCDVRAGDFDRPGTLVAAFSGGDRMLLVSTRDVGRRAAQHLVAITAARTAGVGHIVYTSSDGSEKGDHLRTEEHLAESGVDFTIMRNSLYAEAAVMLMIPAALASGQWRTASGDGRVGFIPREECVASAVAVLTSEGHSGRTYRVAGERNWSLREVAALSAEMFDRSIDYIDLSVEERDAELAAEGLPAHYEAGLFTVAFGASARDDIVSYEAGIREHYFVATSRDVRTLTGRGPTPLSDVIDRHRAIILDRTREFRELAAARR